jgi:diketogulonate reductase-like aldo/keto reductase
VPGFGSPRDMKTKTIPEFIYGTAWKEERTGECVLKALSAGFRAIDTANQKKHYREDLLGEALKSTQMVNRDQLWLQSKYTYQRGQDHRLPYDPASSFAEQVRSSFANTLKNLNTNYLDSYLLHGPFNQQEFSATDWEVWRVMEEFCRTGKTHWIGVSNVNLHQLEQLVEDAEIKPGFVQNRCYSEQGWDRGVREFCAENDITYQGFSLLTANRQLWEHPEMVAIAQRLKVTTSQVIFRFARQVGILPLTGTTDEKHMREDLKTNLFELTAEDMELIESLGEG